MPHNFCIQETPFSQIERQLSTHEVATDGLVVEIGMRPARRMMTSPNAGVSPSSVRYAWPCQNEHHPLPRRA